MATGKFEISISVWLASLTITKTQFFALLGVCSDGPSVIRSPASTPSFLASSNMEFLILPCWIIEVMDN